MTKALVVDDLKENLYLLETLLKGYGYDVQTAANGAEALAQANRDLPDIIISDILMPVMDGFTFCTQCKSDPRLKQIPFIFYTATYTDPKDERFALNVGADAFLKKPIEPSELIEKINEVVSNRAKRGRVDKGEVPQVNLKEYNEILIHKLEDKMAQLDITNKELLESEVRFRTLVEQIPAIIYTTRVDPTGKTYVSPQIARLGFSQKDWEENPDLSIQCLHPADVERVLNEVTRCHTTGDPLNIDYRMVTRDGQLLWFHDEAMTIKDDAGSPLYLQGMMLDITRQKLAEEKAKRLSRIYAMLGKVNQAIVRIRDSEILFQEACRIVVEIGLFRMSWIGLVDTETSQLKPVANAGVIEGFLEKIAVFINDEIMSRGPTVTAIRTGQYDVCNDIENDERMLPWKEQALANGYRSLIAFPLRSEGKIVGAFSLYADEPYFFSSEEIQQLSTLVEDLSFAITSIAQESARARAEQALRLSEAKHRSLFETMTHGVVYQDASGHIFSANPAAERILGLSIDQMQGKTSMDPFWRTIHEDGSDFPGETHPIMVALKTGRTVQDVILGVYNPQADSYRWVKVNAVPQYREGKDRPYQAYAIFEDITEERIREQKLEAHAALSTALRTAQTRKEMLPAILEQMEKLVQADGAALIMQDAVTGEGLVECCSGILSQLQGLHLPKGKGVSGHVMETGEVYVNQDAQNDQYLYRPDLMGDSQAFVCVPLIAEGLFIGVLLVASKRSIAEDDIKQLSGITDMITTAIQRAELQEQTGRQLNRLITLRKIDEAIIGTMDLKVLLDILLEKVTSEMHVDAADVLLLDKYTNILEYKAGRGFRTQAIVHSQVHLGEGPAGQAALERRGMSLPNLGESGKPYIQSRRLEGEAFESYKVVPLITKGQILGVLEIFNRTILAVDQGWQNYLETLANQVAIAIENATLFDDLRSSNLELSLAYDDTIAGWSRALDMRDKETEGHTQRVTDFTLVLASPMGLHGDDLVNLRRGALLHDIGKMGIPDNILLKPGPLTDGEWEIMRRHPRYAFELLSPIQYLNRALDIPYCHHEKWDGTGYPRGLKGLEIPLAARIFSVIDVWDALISDRPYRPAWQQDKALEYIRTNSNIYFDPTVVNIFLRVQRELDGKA